MTHKEIRNLYYIHLQLYSLYLIHRFRMELLQELNDDILLKIVLRDYIEMDKRLQ